MLEPSSPTSTQPRNVERCPQCGYLLTGLPDAGQCPECGLTYDQSAIILNGWWSKTWGSGKFGQRRTSSIKGIFTYTAIMCAILIANLHRSPEFLLIIPLPLAAAAASVLLLRPSPDDLPPIQLILSPNGWVWHFHPATGDSRNIKGLCWFAVSTPFYFLWFRSSPRVILVFVAVFAALFGWASLQRHRRDRRWRRHGIKYFGDIPIVMRPWEPASQISIKPVHPGTWLVVLTQDKDWKERSFRLASPPERLSFEFDLSETHLKHVTTQMATWPITLDVQTK